MHIISKLTVFFENPFWVAVYERVDNGKMEAAKIVFGAEPKDYDVYKFILQNWSYFKFSPPIKVLDVVERKISPKRIKRQINSQLSQNGVGTKAQQALKLQQEVGKKEKYQISKQKKELEEQRKFDLRQEKKKDKHKGR